MKLKFDSVLTQLRHLIIKLRSIPNFIFPKFADFYQFFPTFTGRLFLGFSKFPENFLTLKFSPCPHPKMLRRISVNYLLYFYPGQISVCLFQFEACYVTSSQGDHQCIYLVDCAALHSYMYTLRTKHIFK